MRARAERRPWFTIPGVQVGDRTFEDQFKGLQHAYAEALTKPHWTVLDLGCAEGLIGREFARAGVTEVLGVELLEGHLAVARKVCAEEAQMHFACASLLEWIAAERKRHMLRRFDLVLSLGVCHKLAEPAIGLEYSAMAARELLLFRNAARFGATGRVKSKHGPLEANARDIFTRHGFVLERVERSSRNEAVEYWRRK